MSLLHQLSHLSLDFDFILGVTLKFVLVHVVLNGSLPEVLIQHRILPIVFNDGCFLFLPIVWLTSLHVVRCPFIE